MPTPTPTNHAPNIPTLLGPGYGTVHTLMPQLCWLSNYDPDGDAVLFWVDLWGAADQQSGWITSTCWQPTVSEFGVYQWHVQAKDEHGQKGLYSTDWFFALNQTQYRLFIPYFSR